MIEMQTVMHRVLAHGWKKCVGLALALNAEHHHDIRVRDGILNTLFDAHALFD